MDVARFKFVLFIVGFCISDQSQANDSFNKPPQSVQGMEKVEKKLNDLIKLKHDKKALSVIKNELKSQLKELKAELVSELTTKIGFLKDETPFKDLYVTLWRILFGNALKSQLKKEVKAELVPELKTEFASDKTKKPFKDSCVCPWRMMFGNELKSQLKKELKAELVSELKTEFAPVKNERYPNDSCASPWRRTTTGLCIVISHETKNWTRASSYCRYFNSSLVTFKNQEELKDVGWQTLPFTFCLWSGIRWSKGKLTFDGPKENRFVQKNLKAPKEGSSQRCLVVCVEGLYYNDCGMKRNFACMKNAS